MNWLITGGCGFIGRNLIRALIDEYDTESIRVIDNFSVGAANDLAYASESFGIVELEDLDWSSRGIQIIEGDILNASLALEVCKGADIIVHLAANTGVGPSVDNPRMDCEANVLGTFNYLEASRANEVKRFVFASSGAPIGECIPPIHEEMPCHPVSPYGASKLAGEAYCSAYHQSFNVDTVSLRFGNVYGPGSTHKSSVVAKFIRQAMNGEVLEIYGDGSQTRDFIFTEDLVDAIYKAATTERVGGEVFQIATSKETTVLELTEMLVQVMGDHNLRDVSIIHGPQRVGDVMRNYSDTSKALNKLNWSCKYDLEQGLRRTIQYFAA